MPTKKQDSVVRLKVANTEFTIGDILEITPKLDKDAPDGFQKFNTSKLLMEGIAEERSPIFDDDLGMWDTGFDTIHPSLDRVPQNEKVALVDSYVKHIKEPYEQRFRADLDSNNDDFWSTYIFTAKTGRKFDTKNPKELLELYFILKNGVACNEKEKDYFLRKASYNIRNVKQSQSLEEKQRDTKFEAIGTFKVMLDSLDPKKDDTLYTILEWINIYNVRGADKKTLKQTVLKHLDNDKKGYDNCKRFLQAYEDIKSSSHKEVMENFSVLNQLSQKKKIKYERRQYFIDGHLLGNNLKEAAEKITKDGELYKLVEDRYQEIIS